MNQIKDRATLETIFRMAATLCVLTNEVSDRGVCSKGNGHSHHMAELAWIALGKPDGMEVDRILATVASYDGWRNHGFDWVAQGGAVVTMEVWNEDGTLNEDESGELSKDCRSIAAALTNFSGWNSFTSRHAETLMRSGAMAHLMQG